MFHCLPDDNQSRLECALGSLTATVLLSISGGTADFSIWINRVAVTSQSICIIAILPTGGCMVSEIQNDAKIRSEAAYNFIANIYRFTSSSDNQFNTEDVHNAKIS
jgi:hypothetical protein